MLASAQLRISEFQSDNLDDLDDEDGQTSDWIEIHNTGTTEVDLEDWFLTDDADNLSKWTFPEKLSLAPDGYLVVFASEKNQHTPQSIFQKSPIKSTHTNFKLSLEGEYLALVQPDGETIEHEYAPTYPMQVGNTSYGLNDAGETVYFLEVTPGEANQGGASSVGPIIEEVTNHTGEPDLETDTEMIISAKVVPTIGEVSDVTLFRRFRFDSEKAIPMLDDGVTPDEVAGDNMYTAAFGWASLFGNQIEPGEMIRYRVEAIDDGGHKQQLPLYHDPEDADQYFGTIAANPAIHTSKLPILHWFIENPNAATSERGTKGSVYYLGEFYDNAQFDIHGQSTRGFPKKAYDFDFNSGHRFKFREGEDRVKDVNILTNWADKSKIRNALAYSWQSEAKVPAHWAFPIRIEQNGTFHSTADMVEDGDSIYLKRVGLRSEGALYKMYNTLNSASGAEKKSRKWEDDDDLVDFVAGITKGTASEKLTFAYDHVNIPDMVNFLAAKAIYNNTDFGHKNYYVYRDTGGTNEWTILPWDVDLSLGRLWTGAENYFRDAMEARNSVTLGTNNSLVSLLQANSDFSAMFYRRLRTLMDEYYGEGNTPPTSPWLMEQFEHWTAMIDPEGVVSDADLDYEKWGSWGNQNNMEAGLARVRDEFVPLRREYMYSQAKVPPRQKEGFKVQFAEAAFQPSSGNQEDEYLVLQNSSGAAVDLSDWTISGAIEYTLRPGTVIAGSKSIFSPDTGKLHVVRNSQAFRKRTESPKAGEMLLMQGDYKGQLSARGETLVLKDRQGNVVDELLYEGAPSAAQSSLRITEIMYNPLADPDDGTYSSNAFEYVELKNIGGDSLTLSGTHFADGIDLTFADDATLAPGALAVVVKNEAAFRSRYGDASIILGTYTGSLNNGGESIELRDANGENILSFSYDGKWSERADKEGHSLVILDDSADFDAWKEQESWGTSKLVMGSPGAANQPSTDVPDPGGDSNYASWTETAFTTDELADPQLSGPTADVNGDGISNLMAYALHLDPHHSVRPSELPSGVFNETASGLQFRRRSGDAGILYQLERSLDLESWTLLADAAQEGDATAFGDGVEMVTLLESSQADGPQAYLRLRVKLE